MPLDKIKKAAYSKAYYAANKELIGRKWFLRTNEVEKQRWSKYRLTPDLYAALLKIQGNRCAICKEFFVKPPCVDHDHSCCAGKRSCGKCIRGLLCRLCNSGIGHLRDSVLVVEAALAYLRMERYERN